MILFVLIILIMLLLFVVIFVVVMHELIVVSFWCVEIIWLCVCMKVGRVDGGVMMLFLL